MSFYTHTRVDLHMLILFLIQGVFSYTHRFRLKRQSAVNFFLLLLVFFLLLHVLPKGEKGVVPYALTGNEEE